MKAPLSTCSYFRDVVPPLSLSTTFKQFIPGKFDGFYYSRCGNPTRDVLEKCLATLDNGKYALAFASGLGAQTAIISTLQSGDGIITSDDIYGGTSVLFREFAVKMGIEVQFVDLTDLEKLNAAIKPNLKMIWLETPTNPLTKVIDIKAVVSIVHSKTKAFVVVDNTFLSAYFQRPLDLGADVVMYSLTKYMNGHSDVIMGSIATNNDKLYDSLKFYQMATGIVPSPFDCFLVNRGLKTLALRMKCHSKNSLLVAKFLESHPKVEKVLHPGLPSHPQHELAVAQSFGHSGILSFYIKNADLETSSKFLKNLKIFTLAVSLGGYGSLIEVPSVMTHVNIPAEQREKLGITDALIRMSVGLEDSQDLINDLAQALAVISSE